MSAILTESDLLTHFERIAEVPDAVSRLRQFILDLAVRGKLVSQEPSDTPANAILSDVECEQRRLLSSGEIRKLDPIPSVSRSDVGYQIPGGWRVASMAFLARKLGAGSTPLGGKSVYQREGVPFLRSQNVHNDGLRLDDVALIPRQVHDRMSGTHVRPKDILLNITGASIGRCALVPDDFADGNVSQHVAIIRLFLPAIREFVHLSLTAPAYQKLIDDVQVGVSREGLSMQRLRLFPMVLPPLQEQQRIVARVRKLMFLCDRLEAEQKEREQRRDRLVAASLHRLTDTSDPQSFRTHAHFHLQHLPRLTTRPEYVEQFRQSIRALAVKGKLAASREAFPAQPMSLGQCASLQNGYAFKSEWFARTGIRLLRNVNVSHGTVRWDDAVYLAENQAAEFSRFGLNEGDIVLSLDRPFISTGVKVSRVRACDLPCLLLQRVGGFRSILTGLRPTICSFG